MSTRLIGMVHLGPLPGSPLYQGDFEGVLQAAAHDATLLATAGFDAVMVENFGDSPFFADDVPQITVAAMARAVTTIGEQLDLPLGVNVLRNDARATMYTDQGAITGRAADLARMRAALAPQVEVWADVFVKHATPPPGTTLAQAAADTYGRGGADALIVSGTATGTEPDIEQFAQVRAAVPDARLLAGSGASAATIAGILQHADGAIVGTSIKVDGRTTAPVDPERAAEFVRVARSS
jgi:predicted TIM-barrel enzyme